MPTPLGGSEAPPGRSVRARPAREAGSPAPGSRRRADAQLLVGKLRGDRFEGTEEHAEGLVRLELGGASEHRQAPALGRGPDGVGQQLRLADPGLASDLDHVRLRRLAAGEQAVDLGQLTPANAQERVGQWL